MHFRASFNATQRSAPPPVLPAAHENESKLRLQVFTAQVEAPSAPAGTTAAGEFGDGVDAGGEDGAARGDNEGDAGQARRSDVLPLLLALEQDDPSLGLGRLVPLAPTFSPRALARAHTRAWRVHAAQLSWSLVTFTSPVKRSTT